MLGKCIASSCSATFFNISSASVTSKWTGEGEKMIRALFCVARNRQPSVIFIDEIDSLLAKRTDDESDGTRRIKTELLVQLDGILSTSSDNHGGNNNNSGGNGDSQHRHHRHHHNSHDTLQRLSGDESGGGGGGVAVVDGDENGSGGGQSKGGPAKGTPVAIKAVPMLLVIGATNKPQSLDEVSPVTTFYINTRFCVACFCNVTSPKVETASTRS